MKWTMMSWAKLLLLVVAVIMTTRSVLAQSVSDSAQDNVLTFHGSPDRKGNFIVPGLTWQRAKSLHMDEKFHARVAGKCFFPAPPLPRPGARAGDPLGATECDHVPALPAPTADLSCAS